MCVCIYVHTHTVQAEVILGFNNSLNKIYSA